ncbi:Protein MS5 [Arabidopsis thaliana x Arabidopsis arenosa]|uniref:Protein MS5 n=1 Tax=Arabidopsis thaliana x Arabidopsis arenosa TaxID=1240361 RepID=A0A8T1Y7Z4_9BRAS|nr:Protein MS5 [Arabidopsis thaliana x Arabidopsis arenosa]
MATDEPPPERKRKLEKITPTVEETSRTLYVLEEGRYVPVKKGSDGGYVSPSACDSDEDVDPVLEEEYHRQLRESDGFDCDLYIPNGSVLPYKCADHHQDVIGICAKVGLHCYNFQKGSNFQLLRPEKYNSMLTGLVTYFITAHVIDPATNSPFVFQTCVTQASCYYNEDFRIETQTCRIKPETTQGSEVKDENCHGDYEAIDDFYKGDLPEWIPDDALAQSSYKQPQFYEVQESDIRENDWLNLYADYAFFTLWENGLTKLKFATPLEIKKVVVQTRETMKPKEKLKAGNAIFYISFRDCGLTEEHRAVVRRTTDGHPEHLFLEVKCPVADLSSCSIN